MIINCFTHWIWVNLALVKELLYTNFSNSYFNHGLKMVCELGTIGEKFWNTLYFTVQWTFHVFQHFIDPNVSLKYFMTSKFLCLCIKYWYWQSTAEASTSKLNLFADKQFDWIALSMSQLAKLQISRKISPLHTLVSSSWGLLNQSVYLKNQSFTISNIFLAES